MTKQIQKRIEKISQRLNGSDPNLCKIVIYDPSKGRPVITSAAQTIYLLPNNGRDAA